MTYLADTDEYLIELSPNYEYQVNGYIASFRVYLEDYEAIDEQYRPASVSIPMSVIVESAINFPPYFDPPLDDIFPA